MHKGKLFGSICVVLALAGCVGQAPEPAAAVAGNAPAPVAGPVPADEAGLRETASQALAEQRLYAPAGDNAIEYYLSLREVVPGDQGVENALVELLPYAQIAAEQATSRGEWAEAQRLIGLAERVDARFPALARLRDSLARAETQAAQRAIELAEAAARDAEQARLTAAARNAIERTTAAPVPARAERPTAAAARVVAAQNQAAPTAPAPAAVPPAAAVPVAPMALPKLLEAPQPRYPLVALRRKLEGEVVLELRINADGRVANARVLSASPPGLFDEAAISAAGRWQFESGPAAVTTRQVMRFRLPLEAAGRGG